jgi:hypothetical protein
LNGYTAADSLAQPPDTADEVNAIVKNIGVAASDIHLGQTPVRLRPKRTPLADYSIVYFVIHGLVADVKGLGAQPSKQPTEFDEGLLTASEVAQMQLNVDVRLQHERAPRVGIFDCAMQQF